MLDITVASDLVSLGRQSRLERGHPLGEVDLVAGVRELVVDVQAIEAVRAKELEGGAKEYKIEINYYCYNQQQPGKKVISALMSRLIAQKR